MRFKNVGVIKNKGESFPGLGSSTTLELSQSDFLFTRVDVTMATQKQWYTLWPCSLFSFGKQNGRKRTSGHYLANDRLQTTRGLCNRLFIYTAKDRKETLSNYIFKLGFDKCFWKKFKAPDLENVSRWDFCGPNISLKQLVVLYLF